MVNRPEVKPERQPAIKRKWYIDTSTGSLKPEIDPMSDPEVEVESLPEPVPAARFVSD
jgi:hypothetical protein